MTRLQVVLTDEQDRQLAKLAWKRQFSKAHLVREGIELVRQREGEEAPDPLLDLIGQAAANSYVASLPISTPPACLSLCTTVQSCRATYSLHSLEPPVVGPAS